ncbi:metal-dependent hydrolase family protein [Rhizobium leguminosarum]|jgi:imidazolonepropionase-like amidohydrolase|uniref:metal-dependent hydrolase family protein n=1 Tax=Rhizobium leguminosarum TaxID=384 RepID=UPI00103080F0|nr:amidohydrolase family protein [Rhizobium leguminosarum]TAU82549.1 amidohydrolase family protein [Rhizobium leguminosarum]TAX08738.1 amidohydrolase family protein [Rhizobium leguminosarum]TAX28988.1 amidohydrolase family protein [Rhizobium leguminosarum]TAX54669.1 amidohydrolase family protein [Rhizobium leguminosarum]TAY00534.1 amidohydrolase family protein [Rhizobium leguminosarum]
MKFRFGNMYDHLADNLTCKCCDPTLQALTHRMNADLSRRGFFVGAAAMLAGMGLSGLPSTVRAQSAAAKGTLFENVRIFDGVSDVLSDASNVLVVGNLIKSISMLPIQVPADISVRRIAGGGRTLMPGMIDAHTHIMFSTIPQLAVLTSDIGFINVAAVKAAGETLMRGFTTIRDMGGPCFGLKRGIDAGLVPGPRIWPSGAFISQTGGHGDFRLPTDLPAGPNEYTYSERVGGSAIADDPGTVRKRAREQLALGASQIKIMAGGGVSSSFDPLDVTQFTPEEMHAGVGAAENWGTYATVHAYTPKAVKQAIDAGVRCIEHGNLLDDATVSLLAEKGIWWCLQPFLDDQDATPFAEGSPNRRKQLEMFSGTDTAYTLAKKHKIKTAWGTDTLFDAKAASRQGAQLTKLTRWYTPAEILKMATGDNAQLLALSGLRSPYEGKLGLVQEGALADLLLVDGDPIANIALIEDPAKNFMVIMKDGELSKNLLT